jgi:hypothetical protein
MLKMTLEGASGGLAEAMKRELARRAAEAEAEIGRANTAAARVVMRQYLQELREDIASGGFVNAQRLSKTWRGKVYPDHKDAIAPALFALNKAAEIIAAFELGMTIRARSRRYLAIPVGPAVAIVRRLNRPANRSRDASGRFIDEADKVMRVAAALGVDHLEAHFNRTGHGVLVAPGQHLTRTGRVSRRSGPDTVLFILLPQATLHRRIRGRALLANFDRRFGTDFEDALSRV